MAFASAATSVHRNPLNQSSFCSHVFGSFALKLERRLIDDFIILVLDRDSHVEVRAVWQLVMRHVAEGTLSFTGRCLVIRGFKPIEADIEFHHQS